MAINSVIFWLAINKILFYGRVLDQFGKLVYLMTEVLNNIKRRTCPTNERKQLAKQIKDEHRSESANRLQCTRLSHVAQALEAEIFAREQAFRKRRKIAEAEAISTHVAVTSSSSLAQQDDTFQLFCTTSSDNDFDFGFLLEETEPMSVEGLAELSETEKNVRNIDIDIGMVLSASR